MKRLLDGVRRYQRRIRARYSRRFATLADRQAPLALFVTCADSRVVPNLIASADPGELFVVRNIANLVPPCEEATDASVPAAIAYAVEVLEVADVVVCGHSSCGGMKALLGPPPADPHLARWLDHARPALEVLRTRGPLDPSRPVHDQLSQTSALRQLGHLATYPCVRDRLDRGAIRLHAWWFDIATGTALAYSPTAGRYVPAVEELARLESVQPRDVA